MTPSDTLQRRQRAHDLRAQGLSPRVIQQRLAPVGLTTVKDWLKKDRPTDQDIAAALAREADPATDASGQVGFKMRFPPDLYAALKAEAQAQGGAPMNKVVGCAVSLYLACMERVRSGADHPVDLLGFRP